jgi:hypothetical protein
MSTPNDPYAAPEPNPYAAPRAELTRTATEPASAELAQAEAIRREHIGREANVKSLGQLYFLGAFFAGILVVVAILGMLGVIPAGNAANDGVPGGATGFWGIVGLAYAFAFALNFGLGYGLYHLQTWARWTVVVFTALGFLYALVTGGILLLVNVVMGVITLLVGCGITGLILYVLLSSKAKMVFSPQYKEIIVKTPHIRYKTSTIVKVLLILVILLIAVAIIGALLGGPRGQ